MGEDCVPIYLSTLLVLEEITNTPAGSKNSLLHKSIDKDHIFNIIETQTRSSSCPKMKGNLYKYKDKLPLTLGSSDFGSMEYAINVIATGWSSWVVELMVLEKYVGSYFWAYLIYEIEEYVEYW